MPDTYPARTSGTLAATGQSAAIGPCRATNVSLSGTWVGTAVLQRYINGDWRAIDGASWTANIETIKQVGASPYLTRIDWTRTSGSLVYEISEGPSSV